MKQFILLFLCIFFLAGCNHNNGYNISKIPTPRLSSSPEANEPKEPVKIDSHKKILFYSDRTGHMEIYVMNIDGSNQQQLTYYNTYTRSPAWSRDGKHIAFESTKDNIKKEISTFEIYIRDMDKGEVKRLTENDYDDCSPCWSPDDKEIVFMSKSASEDNYGIFVRNLESNIEQQLLADTNDNRNPDWSPDGTKIAFESNHNGNYDISIMNKSGGDIHDLTKDVIDERNPCWSPDGKKIAYCVYEKGGKSSVYVMSSDGSGSVRLTNSSSNDILPSWSDDGKNIFFSSNRKESMDIYIMGANGGEAKQLTSKFYVDLGAKCQP